MRHSLPIQGVQSRLCTAIVFQNFGRRKQVIKVLLTLSKSGRYYIISQIGLPGFALPYHDNVTSWLYELTLSQEYQTPLRLKYLDSVDQLFAKVEQCTTTNGAESVCRYYEPATFGLFLRQAERLEELKELISSMPLKLSKPIVIYRKGVRSLPTVEELLQAILNKWGQLQEQFSKEDEFMLNRLRDHFNNLVEDDGSDELLGDSLF